MMGFVLNIVIAVIIGAVALIVATAFLSYLSDRLEILEGLADAVLVRCEIEGHLLEALASLDINQDQRRILYAMAWGQEVLVSDVRDVGYHVKNVVKTTVWDAICDQVGR